LFDTVRTSADRAYRHLEHLVVSLELEPGSLTTESELRERVGLGRTPVREAIQRLAWEGLLEIRPRAGVAVAPVDGQDWLRIMEVRSNVEVVLARSAARHGTPKARRKLEAAIDSMTQAAAELDLETYLKADKNFDLAMAEAAGNCHLVRAAFPLQSHARRFWVHFCRHRNLELPLQGHVQVAHAVLEKDEPRAIREAQRLMSFLQTTAEKAAEE
jgi:DNA-binding GntR family transcriptional regulator